MADICNYNIIFSICSKFVLFFFPIQNQIQKEILYTAKSIPLMGFLTSILFLLEVRGYSKLYDNISDSKYGVCYALIFNSVNPLACIWWLI